MIKPMLCESIKEEELNNLNGDYKANIKYDGERIIAIKKGEDVFLINRRGREKTLQYPEIVRDLKKIKGNFIFDGEVITKDGLFNSLQHRTTLTNKIKIQKAEKDYPIVFMVFDLLNDDGDIRDIPLRERIFRRDLLFATNFHNLKTIGFVTYESITNLLFEAKLNNYEGIVIKDMNSPYESRRSKSWLKLKLWNEIEVIVTKYSINPAGIRVSDEKELYVCQIAGEQHKEVKQEIDSKGSAKILIQYLTKGINGNLRFPSFREIIK